MTSQIIITLGIIFGAVILFVTEWFRVDLVALLVLGSLALTGLVTPVEALSGFSNPAVVTVWAVFILSGGLSRTGIATVVGRQILRLAGSSESRLIAVIMLASGAMSAFMNNVGVAAMLLPVVMDIARRTGRPPSKLLIPLAFGSLLGGLTTLIGTPPNILASDALGEYGLAPLRLFDFTPLGLTVMLVGVLFMVLIGRHLLPLRDPAGELRASSRADLGQVYELQDRLAVLTVPESSPLVGRTLAESRLGSILSLNVLGIVRADRTQMVPSANQMLAGGDQLLVTGSLEDLSDILGTQQLHLQEDPLTVQDLVSMEVKIAEAQVTQGATIIGQSLRQADFRNRYGVFVLAIWRDGEAKQTEIDDLPIQEGDTLLVQGLEERIGVMRQGVEFVITEADPAKLAFLEERVFVVTITRDSTLAGKALAESHIAEMFELMVIGIMRRGETILMPGSQELLQVGDALIVKGRVDDLLSMQSLQTLELDRGADPRIRDLQTELVGMVEAVLSPRTTLAGKTLAQIHFREKFGLNVLAILREGQAHFRNLSDMRLRLGDALLLFGQRRKLRVLASEPDFLVLERDIQEEPRWRKAPIAGLIMMAVVLIVFLGRLPISLAAVLGATLMVITGSLIMDEAYQFIEWRAVFLIAGMLPLGIAMEKSGTAVFLADGMMRLIGGSGPLVILGGLFFLTTLASQIMPNAVVMVLMAPIALTTATELGISQYATIIVVALAASASFLSPVSHPANVLIMGPGGYRFGDYVRVGLPLTLVVLVVTLLALPWFWPLY